MSGYGCRSKRYFPLIPLLFFSCNSSNKLKTACIFFCSKFTLISVPWPLYSWYGAVLPNRFNRFIRKMRLFLAHLWLQMSLSLIFLEVPSTSKKLYLYAWYQLKEKYSGKIYEGEEVFPFLRIKMYLKS